MIKSGWGKAAECAAIQTLRETRGARNLAPAFGVRGIPALSVVCERTGAHRPLLISPQTLPAPLLSLTGLWNRAHCFTSRDTCILDFGHSRLTNAAKLSLYSTSSRCWLLHRWRTNRANQRPCHNPATTVRHHPTRGHSQFYRPGNRYTAALLPVASGWHEHSKRHQHFRRNHHQSRHHKCASRRRRLLQRAREQQRRRNPKQQRSAAAPRNRDERKYAGLFASPDAPDAASSGSCVFSFRKAAFSPPNCS